MTTELTVHLTMAELIAGWPGARPVLARHGMACVGCAMAKFETIAEATAAYGVDTGDFLREVARRPAVVRQPRARRRR
jgi:hybrid cluster-associated redox disulfide protein